jgi:hypothetical protein
VRNDGDKPVQVDVQPEPWPPSEQKRPVDWLVLKPRRLTVKAGGEARVSYRVRVPKTAEGDLSAQVYFASMVTTGGMMPLEQRFGCALYVYVAGTERWQASVDQVRQKDLGDERVFEIFIKNDGNTHIRPGGRVRLFDRNDAELAVVPLEGKWPVYKGRTRSFFARVKKDRIAGAGSYGVVQIEYGNGPAPQTADLKFPLAGSPADKGK